MRQSQLNTKNEERKQEIYPKNGKPFLTWQQYLRKHILHSKSETLKKNPWLKETGYNIRDDAQKHLITTFDTNVTKVKRVSSNVSSCTFNRRSSPNLNPSISTRNNTLTYRESPKE